MSFTPLVDTWRQSRQERTDLTPGRRWAAMEADLGADMTVGRPRGLQPTDLETDDPTPDHDHDQERDGDLEPDGGTHDTDEPEDELDDDEFEEEVA